ncbi:MAG: hypothetical protein ABEJ73_01210 [Haloplanus sp.]
MEVRDAVEADADALSAIADVPADVIRNLIHDRTVRVAQREATEPGPNADTSEGESRDVVGFVSFDVRDRTVHVTQLAGTTAACERLLAEPVRFATSEGMTVELLAIADDDAIQEAAKAAGFAREGSGPAFDGKETVRYRLDPAH